MLTTTCAVTPTNEVTRHSGREGVGGSGVRVGQLCFSYARAVPTGGTRYLPCVVLRLCVHCECVPCAVHPASVSVCEPRIRAPPARPALFSDTIVERPRKLTTTVRRGSETRWKISDGRYPN